VHRGLACTPTSLLFPSTGNRGSPVLSAVEALVPSSVEGDPLPFSMPNDLRERESISHPLSQLTYFMIVVNSYVGAEYGASIVTRRLLLLRRVTMHLNRTDLLITN